VKKRRATALTLDLHALGRHPGEMLTRRFEAAAPLDLEVGMIGVVPDSPLRFDLTCQSVGDGVLVQGTVVAQLAGQCARCLRRFERSGDFTLQELYFYPGHGPRPGEDEEEDALFVEDDAVDLEPVVREAVACNLPFSPLCRDDCAGLCQACGADLNDDPAHAHDAPIDARWAGLNDLSVG